VGTRVVENVEIRDSYSIPCSAQKLGRLLPECDEGAPLNCDRKRVPLCVAGETGHQLTEGETEPSYVSYRGHPRGFDNG